MMPIVPFLGECIEVPRFGAGPFFCMLASCIATRHHLSGLLSPLLNDLVSYSRGADPPNTHKIIQGGIVESCLHGLGANQVTLCSSAHAAPYAACVTSIRLLFSPTIATL
jgi:hypothetical protein